MLIVFIAYNCILTSLSKRVFGKWISLLNGKWLSFLFRIILITVFMGYPKALRTINLGNILNGNTVH